MVESEEESVVFPVILYDGERETDVGSIKIHNKLDFKQFQMTLKETLGISYNNLTTYLVDNDKSKIPSERRKILITGKVNFSVLVRERNSYFLAVLKRSRRERQRKLNKQGGLEYLFTQSVSPEYLMYLRQNQLDLIDEQLLSRFHDLQMNNENYINSALNWNQVIYPPLNVGFPSVEEAYSVVHGGWSRALCKDCSKAEKQGTKEPFHLCIYDDVVEGGFRSPVGRISRPC